MNLFNQLLPTEDCQFMFTFVCDIRPKWSMATLLTQYMLDLVFASDYNWCNLTLAFAKHKCSYWAKLGQLVLQIGMCHIFPWLCIVHALRVKWWPSNQHFGFTNAKVRLFLWWQKTLLRLGCFNPLLIIQPTHWAHFLHKFLYPIPYQLFRIRIWSCTFNYLTSVLWNVLHTATK